MRRNAEVKLKKKHFETGQRDTLAGFVVVAAGSFWRSPPILDLIAFRESLGN